MRSRTRGWLALASVLLLAAGLRSQDRDGASRLRRLPSAFVPNLGQWTHAGSYVARFGAMTVFLEERGWTFTVREAGRAAAVRMRFLGSGTPLLRAGERLPGLHHYFLGDDPGRWQSCVPLFGAVRYDGLYPGIDVKAYESERHFEFDLILAPGADLSLVEVEVEGVDGLRLASDGALTMDTAAGPVRMARPPAFEGSHGGDRVPIACGFVLRGPRSFGFEARGHDARRAMLVDPGLIYATYLGGSAYDYLEGIALHPSGAATVAGSTYATNFPTTPGAFDPTHNADYDVFVARLSPAGDALVYSTFLGGGTFDYAEALALDAGGGAAVTGNTMSANFPTTPGAFDTTYNGGGFTSPPGPGDVFVARLSPAGDSLVYSTYLGGGSDEAAYGIALETSGAATIVGETRSLSYPTTPGSLSTGFAGSSESFVTRLTPTGATLAYSTFLGGGGFLRTATAVAVDQTGAATVVGRAGSPAEAFALRLGSSGSGLVYSTFLGGSGIDVANAVALDLTGAAVIVGSTSSTDFPTTPGAFDVTLDGGLDAFVARLSPSGASLSHSTYLGGSSSESATAVALDAAGALTVGGWTGSSNFPTTPGAWDTSGGGGSIFSEGFVTRFSASGAVLYSTCLGGSNIDPVEALALDATGAATVAGRTWSSDFPTTPFAFSPATNGGQDAFVARLTMLPAGVGAFGSSSPGCMGPLTIGVTSMPALGNSGFRVTCSNAPPNAAGLLVLSPSSLTNPISIYGILQWVELGGAVFVDVTSDALGTASVALPIPSSPLYAGLHGNAQFGWFGPTSPPPCPPLGLSASNALEITVQP